VYRRTVTVTVVGFAILYSYFDDELKAVVLTEVFISLVFACVCILLISSINVRLGPEIFAFSMQIGLCLLVHLEG